MAVNGGSRVLVLTCIENETPEHLALKLGAYLSLWDAELVLEASGKHPALAGQEFRPDLLGLDAAGEVAVWVECGNTALHKLGKVVRKWPRARVVLFKENEAKAKHLRADLAREGVDAERVEVYCWPGTAFRDWSGLLSDKVAVFGEAHGVGFNLVVNDQVYATDLIKC
ncbi:MAG: YaeQ family protein [Elusimicrobia bacterium]|nr:YaeQ family protein [Elusimicrobiota bacterium]